MKKLLFALFAVFLVATASAQYPPAVKSYGQHVLRLLTDSATHVPRKQGLTRNDVDTTPQIFVYMDHLYLFTNGTYIRVDSGGSSGPGGGTLGRIGLLDSLAKSNNGAGILGQNIYFQTADHSFPGLMSALDKTRFDSTMTFKNLGNGLTILVKVDEQTGGFKTWNIGGPGAHVSYNDTMINLLIDAGLISSAHPGQLLQWDGSGYDTSKLNTIIVNGMATGKIFRQVNDSTLMALSLGGSGGITITNRGDTALIIGCSGCAGGGGDTLLSQLNDVAFGTVANHDGMDYDIVTHKWKNRPNLLITVTGLADYDVMTNVGGAWINKPGLTADITTSPIQDGDALIWNTAGTKLLPEALPRGNGVAGLFTYWSAVHGITKATGVNYDSTNQKFQLTGVMHALDIGSNTMGTGSGNRFAIGTSNTFSNTSNAQGVIGLFNDMSVNSSNSLAVGILNHMQNGSSLAVGNSNVLHSQNSGMFGLKLTSPLGVSLGFGRLNDSTNFATDMVYMGVGNSGAGVTTYVTGWGIDSFATMHFLGHTAATRPTLPAGHYGVYFDTDSAGSVEYDGSAWHKVRGGTSGGSYTLPTATTSVLGGVKIDGSTITISSGVISANTSYTLPTATTSVLGGVKVDGSTITISGGVISSAGGYTLPTATTSVLGGVKIDGTSITIASGVVSATPYSLPTATTSVLGGVKVDGSTITISGGVISSSGGGSSPPFADNGNILKNNSDNTKLVKFSLAGLTTATTRTITVPDASFTMDGIDIAQTVSAVKTYSSAPNYSFGTASRPLKLDGSKNIVSTQIDLSSSNDVANVLLTTSSPDDNYYQAITALGSTVKAFSVGANMTTFGANTTALASGTQRFIGVYLRQAQTLTGVAFGQAVQGSYTGDATNQVGLYTYSAGTLTLVASSTDDATLWKQTGLTFNKKAFSSTYAAAAGLYFISVLYHSSAQTTAPTLSSVPTLPASSWTSLDFTNSAGLNMTLGSRTSLISSTTMSALSANGNMPILAVY